MWGLLKGNIPGRFAFYEVILGYFEPLKSCHAFHLNSFITLIFKQKCQRFMQLSYHQQFCRPLSKIYVCYPHLKALIYPNLIFCVSLLFKVNYQLLMHPYFASYMSNCIGMIDPSFKEFLTSLICVGISIFT